MLRLRLCHVRHGHHIGRELKALRFALQAMEGSYSELAEQLQGSHVRVAKYQADVDREFAQERFGLKTFPTIVMLPKAGNQVRSRLLVCHLLKAVHLSCPLQHQFVAKHSIVNCTQLRR